MFAGSMHIQGYTVVGHELRNTHAVVLPKNTRITHEIESMT